MTDYWNKQSPYYPDNQALINIEVRLPSIFIRIELARQYKSIVLQDRSVCTYFRTFLIQDMQCNDVTVNIEFGSVQNTQYESCLTPTDLD